MNLLSYLLGKIFHWTGKYFTAEIHGTENIPSHSKRLIIAPKHSSYIDHMLFFSYFPLLNRPLSDLRPLAKRGHFEHFPDYLFVKALNSIPVDRSEKDGGLALDEAIECLKNEQVIGIYPEGTRSPDGSVLEGKTGVARLVLATNAPVLPVGYIGPEKIWPKGGKLHPLKKAKIYIGELMHFDEEYQKAQNLPPEGEKRHAILQKITRDIMKKIAELCKQDYPY